MIPKKIHFCWLSGDPYPPKIRRCINSWREKLPEYEIVKWDLKRFPLDQNVWVKEAFENKKYAFAADYIRFYALYTEGGVYLDSDVEVLKPFDDLLGMPYFLGRENVSNKIEAAAMGASPKSLWVKECLNYYEKKHFNGSQEQTSGLPLPHVMQRILSIQFGIIDINNPTEFNQSSSKIQVLPYPYFSPKNYTTQNIQTTEDTYCIHHFTSTWRSSKELFLFKIEGFFGKKMHTILWLLFRNPIKNIKAVFRLFKERKKWWD